MDWRLALQFAAIVLVVAIGLVLARVVAEWVMRAILVLTLILLGREILGAVKRMSTFESTLDELEADLNALVLPGEEESPGAE